MTEQSELQEIEVGSYSELLTYLYDFATKYPDSFDGGVTRSGEDREGIFVSVVDGEKKKRFSLLAPNHNSVLGFITLLDMEGFLYNGCLILGKVLIEVLNARQEQQRREELQAHKQATEKAADKRSTSTRWLVGVAVSVIIPIVVASLTALLTIHYSAQGLDHEINRLDREIQQLRGTSQRGDSDSPARRQPTTRSVPSRPGSNG